MSPLDRIPPPPLSAALFAVVIVGWSTEGFPLVTLPGCEEPVEAQLLSTLSDADIDRAIAGQATAYAQRLGPQRVLLVGVTRGPRAAVEPAPTPDRAQPKPDIWSVHDEDGRVVMQADKQLELRCGEASITLRADGKVRIRGVDVTTRARRAQRIKGGTVLIN